MRPQSAKAKGRRFQQWCATRFKQAFPHLEGNDIRSLSMGAAGDDLILSPAALKVLPYNFEMKNVENLQLWATIRQTENRNDPTSNTLPCIALRKNHTNPIIVIPFLHFCDLVHQSSPNGVHFKITNMEANRATILDTFGIEIGQALSVAVGAMMAYAYKDPGCIQVHNTFVKVDCCHEQWNLLCHENATLNLWEAWTPIKASNTGIIFDRNGTIRPHIAIDFETFTRLVQTRVANFQFRANLNSTH